MKKIIAVLFATLFLLQGCATAPMASLEKDSAAKSFIASKDKANLYIYRNENFGAAISMDVSVNGTPIGQTAAKTYFQLELDPGRYQVQSKSENVSLLEVILTAGENAYIWQEVKMGLLYARTKLTQATTEQGQKGVLESKLISTALSNIKPLGITQEAKNDSSEKLAKLKKLFDDGIITKDDYESAKTKILKEI